MNLNDLPREILTRCFSHLSTELLTDIILLENIPDNILHAAADNLHHIWYANRLQEAVRFARRTDDYGTGFYQYDDRIASGRYHFETSFDRYLNIHKVLEKKSIKRPLWFHYRWEDIFEMRRDLDEINLAYHGQSLDIHVDLRGPSFSRVRFFPDHDINLKITCLSLYVLNDGCCIDLNNFPKLETFYGDRLCFGDGYEIIVDQDHPSLKSLYLKGVTFSSLPVNLKTLVAIYCNIWIHEDHPKLEALTTLVLENTRKSVVSSWLLRVLWNENLETFSNIEGVTTNIDEFFSMIGSKVKHFGFASQSPSRDFSMIPTLLRTLYLKDSRSIYEVRDKLYDLTAFTHMTSLKIEQAQGLTDTLRLPPNLLKLSVQWPNFEGPERFSLPPLIVDLELKGCRITLTASWLEPARLKRLSLAGNRLSSFKAFLPCCEYLSLEGNSLLNNLEIEAPVLEHINLRLTHFTSIPKLPDSLQVLIINTFNLTLSHESEFPSSLKVLDLSETSYVCIQDCTFPPSILELNLGGIEELEMRGVKFSKGSKLKELILSDSYLFEDRYGEYDSDTINDGVIELPPGLKTLKMEGMNLENIDEFTIPQSVTFLDLRKNNLRLFEIMSHIKTLYLNENPIKSNFVGPLKLPPNLLNLWIRSVGFRDFKITSLPPLIVDLELTNCGIKLTAGWLNTAQLKRLSLENNELSSFKAFLPCCEYLSLERNTSLKELEIEAPVLEHIDLRLTHFTSIPKLPDSLKVLRIRTRGLTLSNELELPSSLKVLDLSETDDVCIQDCTFPPSIQELNLGGIKVLKISGVKFSKGSRLKELILSNSCLSTMDEDDLTTIDDGVIELPPGLKTLKMQGMNLENTDNFTIPQSVTFLDLRKNNLRYFFVKSHIETLYLNENPIEDNFEVHEDLELRVLDLRGIGLTRFSFEMVRAEKLAQLHLGPELEVIDLSKMPANFQMLERSRGCTLIGPDTGQRYGQLINR